MQVVLNWTASVTPNVLWYNIFRGFQSGGPYQLIGQSNTNPQLGQRNPPTTIQAALTTYTDITAPNNQDAYYVISTVTQDGESPYSAEIYAPFAPQPSQPTGASAIVM